MKPQHLGVAGMLIAMTAASAALTAHITPVVVLRKQADVIRETLSGATSYDVTTVKIGKTALRQIADRAHFQPNVDEVKFYTGKTANGETAGVVLFPQVDTQHGPIEIGLTVGPSGTATSVVVTRATAETRPWVDEVERAGVLKPLIGLHPSDSADQAIAAASASLAGMPQYMANVIATAVNRGLTLYAVLH